MPIQAREIPKLIFWVSMLGLSAWITLKVSQELSKEVDKVFIE